jgi:DivIVA domain-containing protein
MTRASYERMTPESVRSASFTSSRLGRRGLDEGEVRAFCEYVSDGLGRLINDNSMLQAEVMRLRERLLEGKGRSGLQPEDGHVQAVYGNSPWTRACAATRFCARRRCAPA